MGLSLRQPGMLLLGALAALLLLWLASRRRDPPRVPIASARLLPPIDPQRQRLLSRRWQLQAWLLALFALLLGLLGAGPQRSREAGEGPQLALVVDRGAALAATGRWERALAQAQAFAEQLPAEALIELRCEPPATPWRGPPAELLAALRARPPLAAPARPERLRELLAAGGPAALLRDRPLEPEAGAQAAPLLADAPAQGNLGLIAAGATELEEGASRAQWTILNGGPERAAYELILSDPTGELRREQGELAAGDWAAVALDVPADAPWLRAELRPRGGARDALRWDDALTLARTPAREQVLRIEGEAPPPLLRALESIPGLRLEVGAPREGVLSIVIGRVPQALTSPLVLILPPPVSGAERLEGPLRPRWGASPLAPPEDAGLGFEVEAARSGPPSSLGGMSDVVLSDERGRPLIARRGEGAGGLLYIGFGLRRGATSWVEARPSFPLFWLLVVEAFGGEAAAALRVSPMGPGAEAPLPVGLEPPLRYEGPGGEVWEGARWRPERPGLVRWRDAAGREGAYATGLLSESSTRLPAARGEPPAQVAAALLRQVEGAQGWDDEAASLAPPAALAALAAGLAWVLLSGPRRASQQGSGAAR